MLLFLVYKYGGSSFLGEEDHLHASSGPGVVWVQRWLMRPICAWKCLEHRGKDNGAVATGTEEPLPDQDSRAAHFVLTALVH